MESLVSMSNKRPFKVWSEEGDKKMSIVASNIEEIKKLGFNSLNFYLKMPIYNLFIIIFIEVI